jgi:hypothetical protein
MSRKRRTYLLDSAPNDSAEFDGGRTTTINSHTDVRSIEASRVPKTTWKQRIFLIGYLTAVAVAMFGWLAALSWAGATLALWLFR